MRPTEKLSLCPDCTACPEVEILEDAGQRVAVRIGEGVERITLAKGAWNTLVKYIRDGVLTAL